MDEMIINERDLTRQESGLLEELEGIISENFLGFVAVGNALAEINEKRLYRDQYGRTFQDYCKEKWDVSRPRAYQLINSSKVMKNLSTIVDKNHLPVNESQTRELIDLQPDGQLNVWAVVVENEQETGEKTTARVVKKQVALYQGDKLKDGIKRSSREIKTDQVSDEFAAAWKMMWAQVEIERKNDWKATSKKLVFDKISTLLDLLSGNQKNKKEFSCSMYLEDREKLFKAGFRIMRTRPIERIIEEWMSGDNWTTAAQFDSSAKMAQTFKELLEDPKILRG